MKGLTNAERRYLTDKDYRKTSNGRKIKGNIKKKLSSSVMVIQELRAADRELQIFGVEDMVHRLYVPIEEDRKKLAENVAKAIIDGNIDIRFLVAMGLRFNSPIEREGG